MNNVMCIIGRLVTEPEIKEEDDKKITYITIAVPRSYKNADGIYETDFIPCILWSGIAETTIEYCKKGDLIGIKGHLQNKEDKLYVVAERITFLSSKNE